MDQKQPQIKNNIYNQLIRKGRIILLLIVLILVASQIVVGLLKKSSNEFLTEYNEVNAIKDFKITLYQLLWQVNKVEFSDNEIDQEFFSILIYQANEKLSECKAIVTMSHTTSILNGFDERLKRIDDLSHNFFKVKSINQFTKEETTQLLINEIIEGLKEIDIILIEIKEETMFYGEINEKVFLHSSLTILGLGLIIISVFIIGGLKFIRNFTSPIYDLVETTELIAKGKRGIKVQNQKTEEFNLLANSFNNMLESLENTTVSKIYLDSIINNMFDSLIVADKSLKIISLNKSATRLLGEPSSMHIGRNLTEVISNFNPKKSNNPNESENIYDQIKKTDGFINKDNEIVPALISCTPLKMENEKDDNIIIVGYDLRDKIEIERKLEESRKRKQIYINEAQEKERLRIATDLHDGLGQMLTAISYSNQEVHNLSSDQFEEKNILTDKIQHQIDSAIKESKNLAHNLIPILLKDFGLIATINSLIEKANEMYKINFSFNSFDFEERIDPKLEKALYRICQESLNNIVKHSAAKNANYQIFYQNKLIVLVIDDDGCGFDIDFDDENKREGIGLISMRERVLAFGGEFSINSQINNGTEIIIEIPC